MKRANPKRGFPGAFRLKSTGDSSNKYGPCEVCGKHASETWSLIRWEGVASCRRPGFDTYAAPVSAFGHHDCILSLIDAPEVYEVDAPGPHWFTSYEAWEAWAKEHGFPLEVQHELRTIP